jgi:hypothetical protein
MKRDHRDDWGPRKGGVHENDHQHREQTRRVVGASELAQMGVCERLVVFEHHFGKRRTTRQRAAISRGQIAHGQFFREGERDQAVPEKGRCYIATLVFGAGPETATLRRFRDRIMRTTSIGRWSIALYYRTAPPICTALRRHPWLQPAVRTALKVFVWLANRLLQNRGEDHGA